MKMMCGSHWVGDLGAERGVALLQWNNDYAL